MFLSIYYAGSVSVVKALNIKEARYEAEDFRNCE